jgi:hypothetical protein
MGPPVECAQADRLSFWDVLVAAMNLSPENSSAISLGCARGEQNPRENVTGNAVDDCCRQGSW